MSWFQYLLQVNLYLTLLYGFYVLFLRNNTFFRLNRIYILSSGVAAYLIPLLQFESIRALFITEQVRQTTRSISTAMAAVPEVSAVSENVWNLSDWLAACYVLGMIFFTGRFLLQLYSVYKARTENPDNLRAHSFFGKIVVSDHIEGRMVILEHEEVHASQWHSADVILFELIGIVNWFNPVVHAIKRTLKYLHEFIADDAVSSSELSKEEYSLLLLSNVFGIRTQELSNNFFNQSLLKRRIIMLHKSKSRNSTLLKYTLCVPLLAAMLVFSSSTLKIEDYSNPITDINLSNLLQTGPSIQSKEYFELFLKRNPQIKDLVWTVDPSVIVYLKNGKKEVYDLKKESGVKKAEGKYGKLPTAPPAPPQIKKPTVQAEDIILNEVQPNYSLQDPVVPMESVQILPEFPGGKQGWSKFLEGYSYPKEARENNISGKILISFIVEKNGSLGDIMVVKDLRFGTGDEAFRLMKTSPKWTPGIQNGLKVRVAYTQAINLTLN